MKNKLLRNKVLAAIIALLFYGAIIFLIILNYPGRGNFNISKLSRYLPLVGKGFLYTIGISVVSLLLSIVFGFLLYLLTKSKIYALKYIGYIFNEIVFGSPLVVFIIVMYYLISVPFGLDFPLIMGTVTLSLFMAPYMKNIFEGAMKTIDESQKQAMTVFGFTTYQKYRYIIFPQLLRVIIPPLIGNLTFIVKGSSLLNFISVPELYNSITTAQSRTFAVVEGYLLMFMMYLIITIPLIRLTKYFEKRVTSWN
jgi:polar amino acid transport system permease protein